MIEVGGVCQCDSSSNLYYNSGTNTCTSCSSAITSCTSCTANVLVTTCNSCASGTFLNSTTGLCQTCTTYCQTCTETLCTLCVSNSFTVSGVDCFCDASSQLYLDTSTNPDSCQLCSTFISNCLTCSDASGSLECQVC